ncbi:hypothetical protein [Streptomyces griseus]|uniref:hypothetical protein n=1 Tax=Streptomyces griseus TaxID=1911 RepID=UPI003802894B
MLGPWLAALSNRRPALHLLMQTDAAGDGSPLSAEALAEIEVERHAHDLLVSPDGSVEEGRSGSHGRGFSVPAAMPDEPAGALAVAAEAGARSLLLIGLSDLGKRLLNASLIDRLTLLMLVTARDAFPLTSERLRSVPDHAHEPPARHPRRASLTVAVRTATTC